jgi:hypothetical protein
MVTEPVCGSASHVDAEPRFLIEGRAIQRLFAAMEGQESLGESLQLVEHLHRTQPCDSPEEILTWYAMGKLLGKPLDTPERFIGDDDDTEEALFQTTAWAWMNWACGEDAKKPLFALSELKHHTEDKLIHVLALSNWSNAVENLLRANLPEAKRRYRRAVDLGSQFGTDTSTAIFWTYSATFLPAKCFT